MIAMVSSSSARGVPDGDPVRVLLVDDTPAVLDALTLLLGLVGGIVVAGQARNGREAVLLAKTLSPDIVVMDLEMPDMDGYAATRAIKSHHPSPRIVILSVHGGQDEVRRAQEAGADGFVVKGANDLSLVKAILTKDPVWEWNHTEKGES